MSTFHPGQVVIFGTRGADGIVDRQDGGQLYLKALRGQQTDGEWWVPDRSYTLGVYTIRPHPEPDLVWASYTAWTLTN